MTIFSEVVLNTNGGLRNTEFWKGMAQTGTRVIFAIDGLEDTNHLYRRNVKWNKVIENVESFIKAGGKAEWDFLVFKHNQHQILEANRLSKKLGFDEFKLLQSDRWLGKKELMPDREYVSDYYQHQESVLIDPNYQAGMAPACIKNNVLTSTLYVDAEGDFYPCCWMGTYRYKYKSVFSPKGKKFNIKDNTLNQILENKNIKDFFESTKQFTSAHECCKIQCGEKHV